MIPELTWMFSFLMRSSGLLISVWGFSISEMTSYSFPLEGIQGKREAKELLI